MRFLTLVKKYNLSYYLYKKPTTVGTKTILSRSYSQRIEDKLENSDAESIKSKYTYGLLGTVYPIILEDSDVKSKDLHEKLSEKFNVKYLSDSTQELDQAKGIIYGRYNRPFCLMTVNIDGKIKNVFFLIDTSSPYTYISEEVLQAFEIKKNSPIEIKMKLNKRVDYAYVTYNDLNILGSSSLWFGKAYTNINFKQRKFNIIFRRELDY